MNLLERGKMPDFMNGLWCGEDQMGRGRKDGVEEGNEDERLLELRAFEKWYGNLV